MNQFVTSTFLYWQMKCPLHYIYVKIINKSAKCHKLGVPTPNKCTSIGQCDLLISTAPQQKYLFLWNEEQSSKLNFSITIIIFAFYSLVCLCSNPYIKVCMNISPKIILYMTNSTIIWMMISSTWIYIPLKGSKISNVTTTSSINNSIKVFSVRESLCW